MDTPLELHFHNIEPSDALKKAVEGHIAKLKKFHDHIVSCRVSIEMPHKSQKAVGNQPDVHVVIRVPGKEIAVTRDLKHGGHKKADTDAYAVLDDVFTVAAARLKEYRRISHGDVKQKSGEPRGMGGESGLS